jgi:hypothetical protein
MKYNKLLRACLAGLLLSLSIVSVRAQTPPASTAQTISPEKQALIRELLELTSSKKTIDAMFKAQADQVDKELPQLIWQAVSGMKELKSLTPEQREEVRLKVLSSSLGPGRRMYELVQAKIDFHKLIEDISLPLHDKYFTESELRDLVTFYKSPTGRKVVEVMPNLLTESVSQSVAAIMPKFTEITIQIQEEETQRMEKEIQASVKTKEKSTKPRGRTAPRRSKP